MMTMMLKRPNVRLLCHSFHRSGWVPSGVASRSTMILFSHRPVARS